MSHSFSVLFTHNRQTYTAVVARLKDSLSIYIPEEEFHHLIPNGRITYDNTSGLNLNEIDKVQARNLIRDILSAIDQSQHKAPEQMD